MKSIPDEFAFINIRLLKSHKAILKELAAKKGLTVSAYIRMIVLDEIEIISKKLRKSCNQ
jgi:predicted DNA binding CopG/RHH family protein